jgi:hypothetical protein
MIFTIWQFEVDSGGNQGYIFYGSFNGIDNASALVYIQELQTSQGVPFLAEYVDNNSNILVLSSS